MTRTLIAAACVLLSAPAWSQAPPASSDYGPGSDRRDMRGDRDSGGFKDDRNRRFGLDHDDDKRGDRGDRGWRRNADGGMGGGMGSGGMGGGGAHFMLRSGDTRLAVRCDGQESMRACVDATLALMDKARSLAPAAPAPAAPRQ